MEKRWLFIISMASRCANVMLLRLFLAALGGVVSTALYACPFCTTLGPTLAQRRDAAEVALLAELVSANAEVLNVRVHRVLKAPERLKAKRAVEIKPPADDRQAHQPGALLLVLGKRQDTAAPDEYAWSSVWLNETSFAYVARLPSRSLSTVERLPYFARYFEHADPLIAHDAYLEFGHAPLDEIEQLADRLAVDRLRDCLIDDSTPPERKGLYGLLLGLAAKAQRRGEVSADFWRLIEAPESDFRAGFDGVLAGYLWLENDTGLARLEARYLDDRQAARGDVRHFATALRVYHDYGRGIAREELLRVYRRLLERAEFAAAAVDDLRRWRDWQSLGQVSSLFGRPEYNDPLIERAVIAYLLACPLAAAERHVDRLRRLVPERAAEAERQARDASGR